jgi:hypothetical protein
LSIHGQAKFRGVKEAFRPPSPQQSEVARGGLNHGSAPSPRLGWRAAAWAMLLGGAVVVGAMSAGPQELPISGPSQSMEAGVSAFDEVEPVPRIRELILANRLTDARLKALDCLGQTPDRAQCQLMLGIVEGRTGNDPRSIDAFERFLRLTPQSPDAAQVRKALDFFEANPHPTRSVHGYSRNFWTIDESAAFERLTRPLLVDHGY